ncbi:DUF1365 domain-containing protein [Caulobacter sp. S45]|uniref:DUF1365 domain-containing protein n=1 Tax=Caulobacter sp. S45 TaxID=1641861 RepID=UPI0015765D5E|nr:DUF1365 family protein [Caulobacter sp. S45]
MSKLRSGLYIGRVGHTRLRPRRHVLTYGVFMLLLDLRELTELNRRLRWFSLGRFNLVSFEERDHGDGSSTPLATQVERHLVAAGIEPDGGAIRLLCLPRVLGYVFNPLSLYFCYGRDGSLAAILYEVSSTFGERHTYLIPADGALAEVRQSAAKRLHVSPFMDMALSYDFKVLSPDDRVRVMIDTFDADGLLLSAGFAGSRQELTDRSLIGACATHPLLTLKVMAAIHWEALKILLKGVRLRGGLPAPADPVSVGVNRPLQTVRR